MAVSKKTTKVVTPIDERETFVSLSKTFADSEQGVHEKLKALYELQAVDIEIDKLSQLRGELPEEVAALENEIANLKSKYARAEQLIEGFKANIKAKEALIVEIDAEIEKYTQLLNSGISNSREYDSMDKELENQKLERMVAEKAIRESYESIEDKEKDLARLSDRMAVREVDLEAKRSELDTIVESTSKEEEGFVARRAELLEKLDERTLSAYERIRKSVHNHLAVVSLYPPTQVETTKEGTSTLYGDSCGGCFQAIPPQRVNDVLSGKRLVICEHCGRIIVSPDI